MTSQSRPSVTMSQATILVCALVPLLVASVRADEFRYEPTWESVRSRYKVPEWFRDAIQVKGDKPCEAAYAFRIKFQE